MKTNLRNKTERLLEALSAGALEREEAIGLALDFIRSWPCGKAEYVALSYEPENELGAKLYHSLGFTENGEMDGDEIVAVLKL